MSWTFTLKDARKAGACSSGYNRVVRALQGRVFTDEEANNETYIQFRYDEPIPIGFVLKGNGIEDAIWALRLIKGKGRDIRMFAVWCARQVQFLMRDKRSLNALDAAERYANGEITEGDLNAARDAARDAVRDAARAAETAAAEAWAAAAAMAAAEAEARAAARAAAEVAAEVAARAAQKDMFLKMINGEAPWQIEAATR